VVKELKEGYIIRKIRLDGNERYGYLKQGLDMMTFILKRCQLPKPSTEAME
jgi:hypothetical protein